MDMTFGERLRCLREEQEPRLTQTQLALETGISQRKISYLERGELEPSLDELRRLCRYYQVSADYLLDLPAGLSRPER
ncbi:helix-turn-helix transcriptional regulator [Dysosmobacter sp. Marseille-Q4140]|nr:helix-turn-helix transcriptional regulator [Dysosmobacter sp. Marseille-Q4140]